MSTLQLSDPIIRETLYGSIQEAKDLSLCTRMDTLTRMIW
jgi:hypothetical protein